MASPAASAAAIARAGHLAGLAEQARFFFHPGVAPGAGCPAVEAEVWLHATPCPESPDCVTLHVLGAGAHGVALYAYLPPSPGRGSGNVALKVTFLPLRPGADDAATALYREAILPLTRLQRRAAGPVHPNICSIYAAYVAASVENPSVAKVSIVTRAAFVSASFAETTPVRIPVAALAEWRENGAGALLVRLRPDTPMDMSFADTARLETIRIPPRSYCTLLAHSMFPLPLPPLQLQCVTLQLLLGVRYMHLNRLIHRDIKPDNTVVILALPYEGGSIPVVQIIDFGDEKPVADAIGGGLASVAKGTPCYCPSDTAVVGRLFDGRADVFSVGTTMYALATRLLPSLDRSAGFPSRFDAAALASEFSDPVARHFLQCVTEADASVRYTVEEAIAHDWLAPARAALPAASAAYVERLRATAPALDVRVDHVCDVEAVAAAVAQAERTAMQRARNGGTLPVGAAYHGVARHAVMEDVKMT